MLLCSQYSSPPAQVDDVHEWEGCGVSSSFSWKPWKPPPPSTHQHCYTRTSSWEIGGASAFCQGVLSHRSLGPLTMWESGLLAPKMPPFLHMGKKTRPEEDTAAHPLLSFPILSLLSLSYPPTSPSLLLFLLPRRSIALIGSLSHWYIDCGH